MATVRADKKFVDEDDIAKYDELMKEYIGQQQVSATEWSPKIDPTTTVIETFSIGNSWIKTKNRWHI